MKSAPCQSCILCDVIVVTLVYSYAAYYTYQFSHADHRSDSMRSAVLITVLVATMSATVLGVPLLKDGSEGQDKTAKTTPQVEVADGRKPKTPPGRSPTRPHIICYREYVDKPKKAPNCDDYKVCMESHRLPKQYIDSHYESCKHMGKRS